ncbi:MAG: hypothetical protein VW378_00285 [bacterium]
MKKNKLFTKEDVRFFLDCTNVTNWNKNSGQNLNSKNNIKIIKQNNQYKFESENELISLSLKPKTLLDCINTFHKIIFQELIKTKA